MPLLSRIALGGALGLVMVAASSDALADCYVDSVGGNDSADGATPDTPFQSQAPLSGCGTVYYKRGSTFNEPVKTSAGSVFTNYGDSGALPAFITTDGVVNSFQGGITIDGLHLEGSSGDGSMQGMGVCVSLGGDSQLLNSEITDCDIGIMLFGDNSLVQGNVVYDLFRMAVDSEDPDVYANAVGGAEGIFVNGSYNEVAYNSFINCKAEADWQSQGDQVGYDGGATEVAVSQDGEVTGLKVHHNYSYNNCGFFEVSGFGVFSDSEFYYNVSIDSAWAMLLQVNETTLRNIRWENNTFVHHADAYTPSIAMIYQAELEPNTVTFNNNMVIFDGANMFNAELDPAFSASNNLIVDHDPGVVSLAGTTADAVDLVAGSEAIDQGLNVPTHTLDYLNRTVPDPSGLTDIGAFEFGSEQGAEVPETPETPEGTGGTGAGGTENTGGEQASSTGGEQATSTGGTEATGTGGEQATSTGGEQATSTGGTTGTEDPGPTCTEPLSLCGDVCVDLASDPNNCGVCGNVCATGELCSAGTCTSVCAAGLTQCGQSCVDLNTDILNCGSCGAACLAGQTCVAGVCTGSATGGQVTQPVPADPGSGAGTTPAGDTTAAGDETASQPSGCACSLVGARTQGLLERLGLLLAMGLPLLWRRRARSRVSRRA
jgi:hypothetical protein